MSSAFIVSALLCRLATNADPAQTDPLSRFRLPADAAARLTLTLSLDKTRYLVSEPMRAEVALTNTSTEPLVGPFTLSPLLPRTRVHYAPDGGEWRILTSGGEHEAGHGVEFLRRLEGGDVLRKTAWLSIDASRGRPPLEQPGVYELYATLTAAAGETFFEVRSNTVRVEVRQPQGEDRCAWEAYTPTLAGLAYWSHVPEAHFPEALGFVRRFPRSPYSRAIGYLTLAGVKQRLKQSRLSEPVRRELQDALEELAAAVPGPPTEADAGEEPGSKPQ